MNNTFKNEKLCHYSRHIRNILGSLRILSLTMEGGPWSKKKKYYNELIKLVKDINFLHTYSVSSFWSCEWPFFCATLAGVRPCLLGSRRASLPPGCWRRKSATLRSPRFAAKCKSVSCGPGSTEEENRVQLNLLPCPLNNTLLSNAYFWYCSFKKTPHSLLQGAFKARSPTPCNFRTNESRQSP